MRRLDNGQADARIVAVAAGDPGVKHYNDISELPPLKITDTMNSFEDFTKPEIKTVVVENFLTWLLPWKSGTKVTNNTNVNSANCKNGSPENHSHKLST